MRRLVPILIAGSLVLAACGGDDNGESDATPPDDTTEDTSDDATDDAADDAGDEAASDAPAAPAGAGGMDADLGVFADRTIGIVSLLPGLEPVDRIASGVVTCVEDNGGAVQTFDAQGGVQSVQAFEQANAAGVDAIYNVANDVSVGTLDAGLAEATAAGRPVVTAWGGQHPETIAITGLEFQSAARVGQYVIDRIAAANGGVAEGKVLIANARVTPSLRQRADAFVAMVGEGTEFPLIEAVQVEIDISNPIADTQSKVESAIVADPSIDAVFASFDTIGLGAAQAVDSSGGDQFVVSFNGDSEALDLLRSDSSFAATAANDLEGTAEIACQVLAMLLAGETPPATTFWMDSPLVTKNNVPSSGFATGPGAFVLYDD
jgi:ABC-type sugar transport system substrate-binding protein